MINRCLLLFCLILFPLQAQVKPSRRTKAAVVKPFTIERLVTRLQDVAHKEYTEGALIRRVEKDGVDFAATEANLLRLSRAGGSATLLETVRRLAPVPKETTPVAVKAEPTGDLEVVCQPAECTVRIGNSAPVSTVGGKLAHRGIKLGTIPVEVTKLGFRPFQSNVALQGGAIQVRAVLQPDVSLRQKWGTELKTKMLDSLGGEPRLKTGASYLASGDATVWGQDGKKYTSSIEMSIHLPGKAFFRTRSGKRSLYEVDFLPQFRSKSNVPEQESRDLDAGLRLYSKYQLYAFLTRLNSPGVQLSSDTNEFGAGAQLHAETNTEKDTITIDSEGKPSEIRENAPLGEGVRALFSGYRTRQGLSFPDKVTIVWAGTTKRGIEIEFHNVELNPDPKKESAWKLKKGNRAELVK